MGRIKILEENYDDAEFSLIGLVSSQKIHKIAYSINDVLCLKLSRDRQESYLSNSIKETNLFCSSFFYSRDRDNFSEWVLLKNELKHQEGKGTDASKLSIKENHLFCFLKSYRQLFDYFLARKGISEKDSELILQINASQWIEYSIFLDTNLLKSEKKIFYDHVFSLYCT
ncbi:IPExxxVDY family protein [Bacteroidetes bacterium endosymbiont of Geopemphigus sp.]|uniref:IPExxxVDY family protein n=1 Tax=Bacteroidetes bacterium endosymbiont of Geopemphigus sp. TaxID=2047937 RepID=UPI000CD213FB|nr:IPExxxVDY family protein [Bacteroidetes bacterium endosymbiont of Geopemphigus sp.]